MGNKMIGKAVESVYTDCRYVGIGMGSVGGPHFGPVPILPGGVMRQSI